MQSNGLGLLFVALAPATLASCTASCRLVTKQVPVPVSPSTEATPPVPSPAPTNFWREIQFIMDPSGFSHSTPTAEHAGMDVPQSSASITYGTRWVVDLAIGIDAAIPHANPYRDFVAGHQRRGDRPVLFWVYQSRGWNLGYPAMQALQSLAHPVLLEDHPHFLNK